VHGQKKVFEQEVAGELEVDLRPYRVDGEVGRLEFPVYRLRQEGQIVYDSREMFPFLFGKEWYKTTGWKDLVVTHGCIQRSYRQTSGFLNRVRHQPEATPHRTIQYFVEEEGRRLQQELQARSQEILLVPPTGPMVPEVAPATTSSLLAEERVQQALEICEEQLRVRGFEVNGDLRQSPVPYEAPEQSVNITVDEVKVKEQKQHRKLPNRKDGQRRKYLQDTVVHVEHEGRRYLLVGVALMSVLRVLWAFLKENQLLTLRLQFFTDGHSGLHKAILATFGWCRHRVQVLLDWYHLVKKCKERLSSALNGAQIRNAILQQVLPLLWYGLVEDAIVVLRGIEATKIKDHTALEKLIAYLKRNRPYIPCYAVRKQLGLRNSSNIGEKMNDLLISDRQKNNGMSWSTYGSIGLASLTALVHNNEQALWFDQGKLEFKLAA
jgi:hypothetical protein